jgi:hypothetical protein
MRPNIFVRIELSGDDAVKLFQDYAKNSPGPVRILRQRPLPTLQHHLEMVTGLNGTRKGSWRVRRGLMMADDFANANERAWCRNRHRRIALERVYGGISWPTN